MENNKVSRYGEALLTAVFAAISYFIAAEWYQVSTLLLNFSDPKWHITVSVGLYTAILNLIFRWILSKRTFIKIDILDKRDKSSKVMISEEPRSIEVTISLSGNTKRIKNSVMLEFPEWMDVTARSSPDLNVRLDSLRTVYEVDLMNSGTEDKRVFKFDICIKPTYAQTGREGQIEAKFQGWLLRYTKDINNISTHFNIEGE